MTTKTYVTGDGWWELLALGYYGRLPWQHPRYRSDR